MNFHVAGRGGGVAINFDFPAGGWGVRFNFFQYFKKIPHSLRFARSCLFINLLYLVRQANKFLSFYFYKCKSYSILVFLCYNHADFYRKLINQAFR